jgi:hypothetical protein
MNTLDLELDTKDLLTDLERVIDELGHQTNDRRIQRTRRIQFLHYHKANRRRVMVTRPLQTHPRYRVTSPNEDTPTLTSPTTATPTQARQITLLPRPSTHQ